MKKLFITLISALLIFNFAACKPVKSREPQVPVPEQTKDDSEFSKETYFDEDSAINDNASVVFGNISAFELA